MGKFREYLAALMLNEMVFNKKKMEEKISSLEIQINLHLIKLLRYKDESTKMYMFYKMYSRRKERVQYGKSRLRKI